MAMMTTRRLMGEKKSKREGGGEVKVEKRKRKGKGKGEDWTVKKLVKIMSSFKTKLTR